MMIYSTNLVKQIPDRELRRAVVRAYYGIIPANGKTYSLKSISENENYYRKLAESVDRNGSKK